mmetsp:Transcript_1367/g.5035  ORF Transcript_1367/g.5035 Transcript_1367/m.5035 type:complete len:274 (+) Transcript_1367:3061-3882(+)
MADAAGARHADSLMLLNKATQHISTSPLRTSGTNGAHSAYTLIASKTAKAQFSDAFCISGAATLLLLKCLSHASRIAPVTSPIVCVIPPNKSLTLSANTSSECNATSSATYLAIIAPNSHSYASADRNILAMVSLNAIHAVEPSRLINSAVICATFDFNGYGTFAPSRDVKRNSFEIIFVNSFFIKSSSSSLLLVFVFESKSRCKIEYPKCLFSTLFSSSPPLSINFFAMHTTERTPIVLLSTGPVNSSSTCDNECIRATTWSSSLVLSLVVR